MAQPLAAPYSEFADDDGAPLAGGKVYTYAAGTDTPQDSYTNSTGNIPAANPVVLDSAGRATIWLSGYYKIVVTDANDVIIRTVDNITAVGSSGDMNKSVYDAANIQEQLVGLTAVQTLTNKTITTKASATGGAGFNIPAGTAPNSPVSGDEWGTTAGRYARINGATKQYGFVAAATYTAAVTCGTSGTVTLNTSFDTLSEYRVGDLVFVQGLLVVSSVSSPLGELRISLNTTAAGSLTEGADFAIADLILDGTASANAGRNVATIAPGGTYIVGQTASATGLTNNLAAQITTSTSIYVQAIYRAA